MLARRLRPALATRSVSVMLAIVVVLGFEPEAAARIWRVTPDHTGDAPTIQAGLDSARGGDAVVLAPGTYTWTSEGAQPPSMLRFTRADITLRGETTAAQTILDAESQGRILDCASVGGAFTIEHLTFANGIAPPDQGSDDSRGGAIDARGTSQPTIRACVFRDNQTTSGAARGGAVACADGLIQDCEFTGNRAGPVGFTNGVGGAVYCTVATIERCTFRDNHARGAQAAAAGAVRLGNGVVRDCVFDANTVLCPGGPTGGAISSNGNPLVERCTFRDNVADAHYFQADGGAIESVFGTIRDCIFLRNLALCRQGPGRGGAVLGAQLAVERCVFVANEARQTVPLGPGLGGAIASLFTSTIEHCTLVANSGGTAGGTGGIHFEEMGTIRAVLVADTVEGVVCSGNAAWFCSNLYGNARGDVFCGIDDGSNFSADPLFCVDPRTSGDVSVASTSPCLGRDVAPCDVIGAGTAGCSVPAVETCDWSGLKRMYR
jgi:hypothetical protein